MLAGRRPRANRDGLTVAAMRNHFLTAKRAPVDSSELRQRSFPDYYATCERIVEFFGRNRLVDRLRREGFQKLRTNLERKWGWVNMAVDEHPSPESLRLAALLPADFDQTLGRAPEPPQR